MGKSQVCTIIHSKTNEIYLESIWMTHTKIPTVCLRSRAVWLWALLINKAHTRRADFQQFQGSRKMARRMASCKKQTIFLYISIHNVPKKMGQECRSNVQYFKYIQKWIAIENWGHSLAQKLTKTYAYTPVYINQRGCSFHAITDEN